MANARRLNLSRDGITSAKWRRVRIGLTAPLQLQSITKSLGAVGFVSKTQSLAEIRKAIAQVLSGGDAFSRVVAVINSDGLEARLARFRSLTPAQLRVLQAMADGGLNKQIAYDLGISEITVKFHVKNIIAALHLPNRTSAAIEFKELQKYL